MYILKYSNRFKRDLKKAVKTDPTLIKELTQVLDLLISGKNIYKKYNNHQLKGEFKNCFECHIRPDTLLIYKKNKKELLVLLLRIGSHSDLF